MPVFTLDLSLDGEIIVREEFDNIPVLPNKGETIVWEVQDSTEEPWKSCNGNFVVVDRFIMYRLPSGSGQKMTLVVQPHKIEPKKQYARTIKVVMPH